MPHPALPPGLRAWAAELAAFPPDVGAALGAHVARLAPLLGALSPRGAPGAGEPDGYDGVARRGAPERLLLSEWALALEHPDEFLRRAAAGEQGHLRPALRTPAAPRRSVVLFDAGPSQLGAPRLAHLALLVLLARRAADAGASFTWGVLQLAPATAHEGFGAGGVRLLLDARSALEAPKAPWEAWRERLGLAGPAVAREAPDVWLVGGARLGRLDGAAAYGRVELAEAEGERALEVVVHRPGAAARRAALPLPPEPLCVRLLRDPFAEARPAPQRLALPRTALPRTSGPPAVGSVGFGARGRQLVFLEADGAAAAMAIPHSPRESSRGRRRRFLPPAHHRLVAFGTRVHGGLVTATWDGERLHLHGAFPDVPGVASPVAFPALEAESPGGGFQPPEAPVPLLSLRGQGAPREEFALCDASGRAFLLTLTPGGPAVVPWLDVTALVQVADRFVAVEAPPAQARHALVVRLATGAAYGHPLPGPAAGAPAAAGEGPREVVFGFSGARPHGATGQAGLVLAMREGQTRTWHLLGDTPGATRTAPEGVRVVGVASREGSPTYAQQLLVVEADGCTLSLAAEGEAPQRLVRVPDGLLSVYVSTDAPLVAYRTGKGALGVYSLRFGAPVLELHGEEGA
jgi:hypothetical protein